MCGKGGGQAGSAFGFDKAEGGLRCIVAHVAGDTGGKPAPTDGQDDKVGRPAQLVKDFDGYRGLAFDHIIIIEGRQEMRAFFNTVKLRCGEGLVKIVANQDDFDIIAPKSAGLVDLLLRRGHRHEDGALNVKVTAGEGHSLGVISCRGADELTLIRVGGAHLSHGIIGAAQFVAADRGQVFAFQPNLGAILARQEVIPLQWRAREKVAQGAGGLAGGVGKLGHRQDVPHGAHLCKAWAHWLGLPFDTNPGNRESESQEAPMQKPKKVVLAYSGGLDTSIILKWLQTEYGCEVITFTADLGQGEELEPARQKAVLMGIKPENIHIVDVREEFVRDFVFPMFRANALYEGLYLLGTSIARPLISQHLVRLAHEHGADAVAHGATGKGNDQVRFELSAAALDPSIKVIAPWRLWDLTSRTKLLEFAEANQIPIAKDKRGEAPFSVDANLLHTSSEGKVLENPAEEAPEFVYQRVVPVEQAPDKAEMVEIGFERGDAVSINGERLSPATILARLNEIGGKHGVGVLDLVENRFVGMKSRGLYETPGGTILLEAHRGIEQITLDSGAGHLKDSIMPRYAELIYNGFWFSPEREALQALIDKTQEHVTGTVRVKLYKGSARTVARWSDHSLYSEKHVTFEEDAGAYDQKDAQGFITLNALRLRLIASRNARVAKNG